MKKVFRALTESACEKQFIGDLAQTPAGWYESTREALSAFKASPPPPASEPAKRGPGRPAKSA